MAILLNKITLLFYLGLLKTSLIRGIYLHSRALHRKWGCDSAYSISAFSRHKVYLLLTLIVFLESFLR